ncbi:hypothetical protein F5Y06DRAFT_270242 [Hypoxylon sp. FL0890]|nr:hypothetical protein F5Y06DRAFT_270242 [Hypoxylon sp. FL0890]
MTMKCFSRKNRPEYGCKEPDVAERYSGTWSWICAPTPPRHDQDYIPLYEPLTLNRYAWRFAVPTMSTFASLSSSTLLGPRLVSFLGLPSPTLWLPASLQRMSNSLPVVVSIPRTALLVLTLHCYCMTTLSLYKIRGNSRHKNITSGIVLLLGLVLCSFTVGFDGTWAQYEAEVAAVLPLLISLSLLLSASFHTILDRYQRTPATSVITEKG